MKCLRAVVLALALVGCGSGGGFPDAMSDSPPPPGGTFSLAWSLTDTASAPVTCEQVGGLSVTLLLRNRAVMGGTTEVFSCGSGMGTTPPVAPGLYDVNFELTGINGLISTAPLQQGLTVTSGQDTPLQPVTFAVDAVGGLDLHFTANATGGNCAPAASMGAGITNTTITLERASGPCEPVTFDIAAGATQPASTYTVNCTAPALGPCIETDQGVTVTGVTSGDYIIRVRGKVGALDCYTNNDALKVPSAAGNLVRTLNLAHQATTPGC